MLILCHQIIGIDLFFGQPRAEDHDDDEPEDEDDDDEDETGDEVQEFVKRRWNLNASFRDAPRNFDLRPETFDLINSRMLAEGIGIGRWQEYISQLSHMLKPGGYVQVAELHLHVQSSNGTLPDDSCLGRWWVLYRQASDILHRDPRVGGRLHALLTNAGLVDVRSVARDIPLGRWKAGILDHNSHIPASLLTP